MGRNRGFGGSEAPAPINRRQEPSYKHDVSVTDSPAKAARGRLRPGVQRMVLSLAVSRQANGEWSFQLRLAVHPLFWSWLNPNG